MRNLAAIKVKANNRYQCQECGSTEFIQAHHEIPGDDNTLIVLCAECHSKRHPNLPRALFFNKTSQPYWHNKSASSLARELDIHPRTVIRAAKRLEIPPGELTTWDEELIRGNIAKPNWRLKKARQIINKPTLSNVRLVFKSTDLLSVKEAALQLGISKMTIYRWMDSGELYFVQVGSQRAIPKSEQDILRYLIRGLLMRYDNLRKLARNKQLVKFRVDNPGLSLKEIGQVFNISAVRVYQILQKYDNDNCQTIG